MSKTQVFHDRYKIGFRGEGQPPVERMRSCLEELSQIPGVAAITCDMNSSTIDIYYRGDDKDKPGSMYGELAHMIKKYVGDKGIKQLGGRIEAELFLPDSKDI